MIEFRLEQSGLNSGAKLFTDGAIKLIYEYSSGYPRKIAVLCHNALEMLVMTDKSIVDQAVMRKIIAQEEVV